MNNRPKSPMQDPELERRIERAEAAVAVLKPKFRKALDSDLAKLSALANANLGTETLADLRALIHDIKGNAGGFGFNLVSEIAACLNAYLDAIAGLNPRDTGIIRDHCNSMAIAAAEPLGKEEGQLIDEFIRLSQQLTADARNQPD